MIIRRRLADENFRNIEYFQSERKTLFDWINTSNVRILSETQGNHMMQTDDAVLIKILDDRSLADFTLRFE